MRYRKLLSIHTGILISARVDPVVSPPVSLIIPKVLGENSRERTVFPAERSLVIVAQPDLRHKAKPSFAVIVIFSDVISEADISCTSEAEICHMRFRAIAWYTNRVDIEFQGHFYLTKT